MSFRANIRKVLNEVIDEHLETYKVGEIRDFVDAYIQQIKESSPDSSFYSDEGSKKNFKTFTLFQICTLYVNI